MHQRLLCCCRSMRLSVLATMRFTAPGGMGATMGGSSRASGFGATTGGSIRHSIAVPIARSSAGSPQPGTDACPPIAPCSCCPVLMGSLYSNPLPFPLSSPSTFSPWWVPLPPSTFLSPCLLSSFYCFCCLCLPSSPFLSLALSSLLVPLLPLPL